MTQFELILSFFSSGIFLSLLAMFYRMGKHHQSIDLNFEKIQLEIKEIKDDIRDMRKDISRIDKEVAVITATLRFNGFDLDRHKAEGE